MKGFLCAGLTLSLAASASAAELDASFGMKGVRLYESPLGGEVAVGYGVAVDSADRIVVGGVLSDSSGTLRMALWRFASDGAPDPSFGTGGWTASPDASWGWALALDPEGRALLAGFSGADWQSSERALLRRFLPDGGFDDSFGTGGVAVGTSPAGGAHAGAHALALMPSGRIVLAGEAGAAGAIEAALWGFTSQGLPDPGFGRGGALVLSRRGKGREARLWALRPSSTGVLAAGSLDWERLALWKLRADGTPAPSFGQGGLSSTSAGMGRALLERPDGKVWAAGFRYARENGREEQAVLSRFLPDGKPDPSYRTDGARRLPAAPGVRDRESFAAVTAKDGAITLAGYTGDADGVRAAFWRLDAEGEGDAAPLVPPHASEGTEDRVYALAADREGRVIGAGFSRGRDGKRRLALWRVR